MGAPQDRACALVCIRKYLAALAHDTLEAISGRCGRKPSECPGAEIFKLVVA